MVADVKMVETKTGRISPPGYLAPAALEIAGWEILLSAMMIDQSLVQLNMFTIFE